MKINSQASRDNIRAKYGSVREFARQCLALYHLASLPTAYDLVGKVLTGQRGVKRQATISGAIRKRMEDEGLIVFEEDDCGGGCSPSSTVARDSIQ